MNTILNAVRIGVSLKGCILYVTLHPCGECAKAIVQAGIKQVILDNYISSEYDKIPKFDNVLQFHDLPELILKEGKVKLTKDYGTEDNPNKILIRGSLI